MTANLESITMSGPGGWDRFNATPRRDPSRFLETLSAAGAGAAGDASGDPIAPAREAATQLVAEAFIKPVLEAMHESPWGNEGPFAPGPAERRFTPLLDEHLADRIAQRTDLPLVDAIVRQITTGTTVASSSGDSRTGAIDVQG